jgi:hypothetical protein
MTPLLATAALLHPRGRRVVLERGLALSDAAAGATFRSSHLAATFANAEVTPFDRFPLNLLAFVGAHPDARFVEVACADDYYESIDMASAVHPQSLACYEMYGRPLTREHGAPLRLVVPTKLGYKQAKYIVGLRVTSVVASRRGYWEDLGYRHGWRNLASMWTGGHSLSREV